MIPRVWAPAAGQVELEIGGDRVPMEPGPGGWWHLGQDLVHGTRYRFVVDGDPLPDPRSRRQPEGVHGPSEVVDPGRFRWMDDGWQGFQLPSAVLYELHVGTFTPGGTFEAAAEKLDHLVDLGADAVEVMPVAPFPGHHGWGYDGVDLWAVHEPYGGPDGFARFVDACHTRRLGVVLDVVYNHLGPDGNHLARFGPYFSERHHTPWGSAVNLDGPGSDEVREFFAANAEMWFRDYHVDALRLDAVHALVDTSAVPFLEELTGRIDVLERVLGRRLWLIAESDRNDPRTVTAREAGGLGLDASWSDDLHHALHVAATGERDGYYEDFEGWGDVVTALRRTYVYDGRYSRHRDRRHGRPIGDVPADRFLGYVQTHDQVGNRARGERFGQLTSMPAAKAAAAIVLLAPTIPMLFQGEEWAAGTPFPYFCDHQDPALGRAVSEGRRSEFAAFGWDPADVPDPQDRGTYESAVLDWDERHRDGHADVLAWYRSLVELRRSTPALRDGRRERMRVDFDDRTSVLTVQRGPICLVVNGTDRAGVAPVPAGARLVLASDAGVVLESRSLALGPWSAAVLRS